MRTGAQTNEFTGAKERSIMQMGKTETAAAHHIICPSDFFRQTVSPDKHQYSTS